MGNIHDFQKDLRNGMTLEKALQKHGLTFKEACDKCKNFTRNGEYHNIYLNRESKKFKVEKMIDSHVIHFGSFEELEDAVKCRDFYETWGWDKNKEFKL